MTNEEFPPRLTSTFFVLIRQRRWVTFFFSFLFFFSNRWYKAHVFLVWSCLVVSSHVTYGGSNAARRRSDPWVSGVGCPGLCGWSTTVAVWWWWWWLTDRHCVRKRLIDSTTVSPSESRRPSAVDVGLFLRWKSFFYFFLSNLTKAPRFKHRFSENPALRFRPHPQKTLATSKTYRV